MNPVRESLPNAKHKMFTRRLDQSSDRSHLPNFCVTISPQKSARTSSTLPPLNLKKLSFFTATPSADLSISMKSISYMSNPFINRTLEQRKYARKLPTLRRTPNTVPENTTLDCDKIKELYEAKCKVNSIKIIGR